MTFHSRRTRSGAPGAPRASYRSQLNSLVATAPRALTRGLWLLPALVLTGLRSAEAAPYASNVVITDTNVSFVLNQPADVVE